MKAARKEYEPPVVHDIPTEFQEQVMLVKWMHARGLTFFSVPNSLGGKKHDVRRVAMERAIGLRVGAPDLVLFDRAQDGKPICVEMKRSKGGLQSDAQKHIEKVATELGWHYVLGRGFDDARKKLEALLPVRG